MKQVLLTVSQFGIFFTGLFGGFLRQIAPPDDEGHFWIGLAPVIAGIVFLLVKLKAQRLIQSERERRFYRLALLALPMSIILFGSYHSLVQSRTASYAQGRRIIGSELTPRGREVKESQNLSNEELLEQNAGNPQGIWTERSINASRMLLGCAYALSVGLFAFGLIGGFQGLKDSP